MSKEQAEKFFDRLEKEKVLQVTIKQGLEKLAKDAGCDATEAELADELAKRWGKNPYHPPYSEPPGF
jgi:FKBP-type peptidyl-prolyl cis-trans isomerase (trigger factor)